MMLSARHNRSVGAGEGSGGVGDLVSARGGVSIGNGFTRALKHLKIGPYGVIALLLMALAISLRILLAAQGWPRTNSDEDTLGLMALHIAYRGEHPIFYYGQNYMGALEAYLGAALFHIFGVSVFTLRLGLIFLFALFLVSTYLLASLLYTKKAALVTLALLSLGSSTVLIRELTAIGGYPETLLLGSLAFLVASWLALSSPSHEGKKWLRLIGFGGLGLVMGLGIWSDFLILPFALMSGLLLILFCWRELRKWAGLFLLVGLIIGAFPLIIYNLHAQPGQDSLSILWRLQHNVGTGAANLGQISLLQEIQGTIQVSLPTATGNPFCPITELPFLGPTSSNTLVCSIVRTSWGVGFIILFVIALFLTTKSFWTSWREFRSQSPTVFDESGQRASRPMSPPDSLPARGHPTASHPPLSPQPPGGERVEAGEGRRRMGGPLRVPFVPRPGFSHMLEKEEFTQERQTVIRYFAQLMLLGSAALSLLSFTLSPAPAVWPSIYSRYLIGLLIATPALISPLLRLADKSAVGTINRPLRLTSKGTGGELPLTGERSDAPSVGATFMAPLGLGGGTIPAFVTGIGKNGDPGFKVVRVIGCRALLVLVGLTFLAGTVLAFADIPATQGIDRQEYAMVQNLSRLGITHIYSDYWTCNRIIFESQEKVICGVIDDHLQPTHNRYPQYYAIVSADPHSAYAFSIGSSQSVTFGQQAILSGKHYQRFVFDGYVIYIGL